MVGVTSGSDDVLLDPGEAWSYTCSTAVPSDQDPFVDTATELKDGEEPQARLPLADIGEAREHLVGSHRSTRRSSRSRPTSPTR